MAVADTSWLVALHVAEDHDHPEAVRRAPNEPDIVIPDVILGEFLNVIYVLSGGKRNPARASAEVRTVLKGIQANTAFRFTNDAEPTASRTLFLANPNLSYPDAVAIQVALRERQPLLTFDGDQRDQHEDLKPTPNRP